MRTRFFILVATGMLAASADGQQEIDFEKHIRPIIQRRCVQCHGQEDAGGLRLDTPYAAARGGHSGRKIIDVRLAENELFRRISSTDPEIRMPAGGNRLPEHEIELIRRWAEQGSIWPETDATKRARLVGITDIYPTYFGPYKWTWLGVCLFAISFIEFWKWLYRRQHPWATGRLRLLSMSLSCIQLSWYVAASLAGASLVMYSRSEYRMQVAKDIELQASKSLAAGELIKTVERFGNPPVPHRTLDAPTALSRTYYRGNCERDPKLVYGGNYRTASLHIFLVDGDGDRVDVGDQLPDQLLIRYEIERAPGTPDFFFSDQILSRVFLSQRTLLSMQDFPQDEPVDLKTVEEGQRWAALFPIRISPDKSAGHAGQVYVHRTINGEEDNRFLSTLRMGIVYDLKIENGRLVDGSDLWMGHLLKDPIVPDEEWMSASPIQVIEGTNTADRRLLGVDEYLRR